jgi:hypothetical protein
LRYFLPFSNLLADLRSKPSLVYIFENKYKFVLVFAFLTSCQNRKKKSMEAATDQGRVERDTEQVPERSEEHEQNADEQITQASRNWANRRYTIPPKEALDTHVGASKKLMYSGEILEVERIKENAATTSDTTQDHMQSEPQPLSPNILSLSGTTLTTAKKTKGNVLQASLEFGIAGISLSPPLNPPSIPLPPPPPAKLDTSKSQSALSRFQGLFSSSEAVQPLTSPPTSPTDESGGFFRKLTTRFTSAPHLNTPLQHNFHTGTQFNLFESYTVLHCANLKYRN